MRTSLQKYLCDIISRKKHIGKANGDFLKYIVGISLLLWVIGVPSTRLSASEILVPIDRHDKERLPAKLLKAAINRGGKYTITYPFGNIDSLPFSTRIQGLRNREFDIFAAISKPEYEREFQAIYVPLYRGLMGMRLAIVKRSNKGMFKNINDIDDLRKFTAGQGKLWADSTILEANNLPIVKELKYTNLFRMLEADRFDYFPRGAHEPWTEIADNNALDLIVDEHIMLWYDAPFYFFVRKSNTELANHLTEQFNQMIASGEFYDFFINDPDVEIALTNADLASRKIIRLNNPHLTPATPMHRTELWHNPAENLESL